MQKQNPAYVDFTWGAGGSTSDLTLELCVKAKTLYGMEPNMHLTCTNMDTAKVCAIYADIYVLMPPVIVDSGSFPSLFSLGQFPVLCLPFPFVPFSRPLAL